MDSNQCKCNQRKAFSLLEVLIAMLLGAFLMLAIFETFFVSARYRMLAGENHARGIELSNALKDLTSDLLAQSNAPIETSPRKPVESMELALGSKVIPPRMNFRDTFALDSHLEWKRFFGTQNYVALRTRAWNSRFSRLPAKTLASGESLVVWWLYRGSQLHVDGWLAKDLSVSKTLKLPTNPKGLIRTQFFIDSSGKECELAEVILPDAVELKLRYFNGSELQNDWDTDEETMIIRNRVPTAIEVRMKLENEEIEHWIHIPAN
jgi:prepilin-type N-terminal cleavage/methylation domain-containing protein